MTSNICRANFSGGRTAQGNNRYQWDYGQILEISGIDNLPDPFTAQFSNTPVLGTAKTAVGTGGRVEIPNEYFVSGQNIYCFIVLHTDEDDGRTVYIATIPVTKRPKPIDDPITPTQQSTIDTAIAALQAGVSRAEGFAQTATEQAGIATSAANTATQAAETATGAVADVEAAATRAETAADGAEASATAAEASATNAEAAKTAALAAKDAAETAAASAEQSATDAGNYAGLAEEAEQDAQAAKTAAEASATAAAGSASAASGSASQAAQKASEASASATAAQTSATNAEAAKTGAEAAQAAAETAQASAEEAAANAEQSAETAEWYAERVERFLPTDTASGEIASFPDGADSVPIQSVVVSMEPIQDLHGYDHPWPVGGGKNLFDQDTVLPSIGFVRDGDAWFVQNSSTPREQIVWENTGEISGSVALTYTYKYNSTSSQGVRFRFEYTDGTTTDNYAVGIDGYYTRSFTSNAEKTLARIKTTYGTGSASTWFKDVQVSFGAAMPYSPYSNICPISGRTGAEITVSPTEDAQDGTTYIVDWSDEAGTVYGGTLDVVSGELVVDRAMVDLGTLNWQRTTSFQYPIFFADIARKARQQRIIYSPRYKYIGNFGGVAGFLNDANGGNYTIGNCSGNQQIYIRDDDYTDKTEFKTAMDGIQLVYDLATPITYHLTPQEVRTLLGTNNVWSDAGSVAVTYKADVQLYIDKRISALS